MLRLWVWPLLGFGIMLILLGAALLGKVLSPHASIGITIGCGLLIGLTSAIAVGRPFRTWREEKRLRANRTELSETAEKLTPLLFGSYSPYVIESAEKLAEARDTTAVPALLIVLQRCVDEQRPGWREVAEALVNSLARIGDRRALDLLYRLENVRGIGVIPSIREAIAAIEPQTSLLRPGSADGSPSETLLRPAHGAPASDNDPVLLLRPTKD